MSVGSLTTTFTPPASCLEAFSTITWSSEYYVAGPSTTKGCMPDNFQFSSTNFYSPGICPVGYTAACQSLNAIGTVSETVVTCCPTSYVCITDVVFTWQLTFGCQSIYSSTDIPSLVVISGTTPVSTVSTTANGGGVNAFSIQIRYQSTDFQSSQATRTLTTTVTSTSSNGSTGGGREISPGTAAGIGVGSAAGALFLAGVFIFIYTLGRRRRQAKNPSAAYSLTGKDNLPVDTNITAPGLPIPEMPEHPN